MIVRTWHGVTKRSDGDAYERFMIERAAPDYASIPGLIKTTFCRRDTDEESHFVLITMWQDIEAVKAFAGQDARRAKYYPEDEQYLLEKEAEATNLRVFFDR